MSIRNLPQDEKFIKHCIIKPENFSFSCDIPLKTIESRPLKDFIIFSAASFCDNGIDHLLDGYSCGIFVRMSCEGSRLYMTGVLKKIGADENLRNEEEHRKGRRYGLFVGRIYPKCLLGRLPSLLFKKPIERETAHQPIYFPASSKVYFCSSHTYPAFKVGWNKSNVKNLDVSELAVSGISQNFNKNHYTCMHPFYDINNKELLTYTFYQSKLKRKTTILFYTFGPSGNSSEFNTVEYKINDRVALHMFGFTDNYFILFASPLVLKNLKLICGSPVLRALDESFCSDLIIHCIPRNSKNSLKSFFVNTKQQGYVYHTINCYEENDYIIVDAFVSKLNPLRESSQFELGNKPVYDNEGDPFRYQIFPKTGNILSKIISANLDSSIDFHCINNSHLGKKYRFWWMVSHERIRNESGKITRINSRLCKFDCATLNDPLAFSGETRIATRVSNENEYLRTPLFAPHTYPGTEDDGKIFCWCYRESSGYDHMNASLIIFSSGLDKLFEMKVPENKIMPYSVHSVVYVRDDED